MKSLKTILAASALAVAGRGSGDEDDEAAEGPLGGSRALVLYDGSAVSWAP